MRHFSGDCTAIRLLMDDEIDRVAGGEGEDTDDVQPENVASVWTWFANLAGGAIAGYLGNRMSTASQREAAVSGMFDPSQVAAPATAWQNNGGLNVEVPAWNMQNGDTFIDTNRNGLPDTLLRTDQSGNVWENTGGGWVNVMARS